MRLIAIDGACRRNGKPDCTSSGGVFIIADNHFETFSAFEYGSTNQRGELLALLKALDYAVMVSDPETYIITDSEYIFNAMTKHWYVGWQNRGWTTASGDTVKNKDIWLEIAMLANKCVEFGLEIHFYHIKGHCIPFGKVTAENSLAHDPFGKDLYEKVSKKFDSCLPTKRDVFNAAQELSLRNNGFKLPENIFKKFVVANTIADAIATKVVDAADNIREK